MKSKSFTLIELLVVIVIIGILAGVIIVSVSSSINKANFAKAQAFSNTVQNELLGDLVSEWTFNSPAVANITEDSWGNNNGTLMGANGLPQLQTKENCVYGTCYLFDGVDDYILVDDNVSLKPTTSITISTWVKKTYTTSTVYGGIIGKYHPLGGGTVSYRLGAFGDRIRFDCPGLTDATLDSDAGSFSNTDWAHVVAVYNGFSKIIYLNGIAIKSDSATGTIQHNTKNLIIGGDGEGLSGNEFGNIFSGLIDDVRIYKAALSSSQIKQQYVAGLDSLLSKNLISQEEYNQNIKNLALR